jgi:type IV fimbrial biogenesis protein FimT
MKAKQAGFTLLEMMVTVGIAALLLGLAIPSLVDFIRNSRITSAANDMLVDLNLARTESVKRRSIVTLCLSDNSTDTDPACGNGKGWIVFEDLNGDGNRDAGETVFQAHAPPPASIASATRGNTNDNASTLGYVMYAPSGFRRVAGSTVAPESWVLLCDARRLTRTVGSGTRAEYPGARLIEVSGPGRALVTRAVSRIGSGGLNLTCPTP